MGNIVPAQAIWQLNNLSLLNSRWCVSNRFKVQFWSDIWLGTDTLISKFPLMHAISCDKNMYVKDATDPNIPDNGTLLFKGISRIGRLRQSRAFCKL